MEENNNINDNPENSDDQIVIERKKTEVEKIKEQYAFEVGHKVPEQPKNEIEVEAEEEQKQLESENDQKQNHEEQILQSSSEHNVEEEKNYDNKGEMVDEKA